MDSIVVSWKNINKYSNIPIEYRFVDWIEVIPNKKARGYKAVSSQDWFFKIHFPDNPIMPGVMVMESLQQTGALIISLSEETKESLMVLKGCDNMRMYNSVRPGDILKTYVELESYYRGIAVFRGEAKIKRIGEEEELLACSMAFTMCCRNEIQSVSINEIDDIIGSIVNGNNMVFDYSNISDYLAVPPEYRFIDRVLVLDCVGKGKKNVSSLDWYFRYYDNEMPIGCIMEAIMQTGVLLVTKDGGVSNPLMMFNGCRNMTVSGNVRPGDILDTFVQLKSYRNGVAKYKGIASIEGREICSMEFTLVQPDELSRITERLKKRRKVE